MERNPLPGGSFIALAFKLCHLRSLWRFIKNDLTAQSALRSEFVQRIEGAGVDLKSKRRGLRLRAF